MTLTDEILKKHTDTIQTLLKADASIANQIDIYGFTPLIEAAIVNDVTIAQLLINYGADVRLKDLKGNTALQWAVENNNWELTELLLKKGADPNAYGRSVQPILVLPLLRRQQYIKELLYRYGADLKFAQDYISIKLIGHRFEIVGKVDIVDHNNVFIEMNFEGFILEFTLGVILESLLQLKNNFAGRILRPYFDDLNAIIEAFITACELNRYQQYLTNRVIDQYTQRLEYLARSPLLLMPVGYEGHAITFVKCGDLWAKCDRGANSKDHPSVEIFHMGNPQLFTAQFLKKLLYQRQNKYFLTHKIVKLLDLTSLTAIPLPSQLIGNCSWANVEAAIPAMILMRWLQANPHFNAVSLASQHKKALYIYKRWLEWDKDWALHHCVESFYDATPARKASRAAVLAAVLVQTCNYENPKDMARANKILTVLTTPEYRYVLNSYLKVYNNTPLAQNLRELIDLYGNTSL